MVFVEVGISVTDILSINVRNARGFASSLEWGCFCGIGTLCPSLILESYEIFLDYLAWFGKKADWDKTLSGFVFAFIALEVPSPSLRTTARDARSGFVSALSSVGK